MAAISGWYLVLLIPSALLVLLVWMLSRQKWGRPPSGEQPPPPDSGPTEDRPTDQPPDGTTP